MKQYSIVICVLLISTMAWAKAPVYEPFSGTTVVSTISSVNSIDSYSSGSRYSSQIYEVEQSSPMAHGSIHKAPPGGGGESGYDPSNPQYGALPDGTLFLLLLAALTALYGYVSVRRKKNEAKVNNL